jgi:glucose-1-phosphate thymidylyltransferase
VKGVILAGGTGSRLYPITRAISKQLMPVYDKPMVYYPLSTLMAGGVREILVITTPEDRAQFERLLGDGSQWGVSLGYATQDSPEGIAQALLIAESFLAGDHVVLILGDNIFHGGGVEQALQGAAHVDGALIFAYRVANPQDYGVVEFDADRRVISIEEKPTKPASDYVIPGLYVFDSQVADITRTITPSARGELEITAVNDHYLRHGTLRVETLDRGATWLDTGTFTSLMQASEYVKVIEDRQGQKVGCVEEVAWRAGWIDDARLRDLAEPLRKSGYGDYLLGLLSERR